MDVDRLALEAAQLFITEIDLESGVEEYALEAAKLLVAKIDLEASTDYFPFGKEGRKLLYAWYDTEKPLYDAKEKHDTVVKFSARYVIKAQQLLAKRPSLEAWESLKSRKRHDKMRIKRLVLDYSAKVKTYYKLLHEVEAFKEHVYAAFSLVQHELCTSQCVIAGHGYDDEYRPDRNLICKHSVAAQQMHEAETDIALLRKRIDKFLKKIR